MRIPHERVGPITSEDHAMDRGGTGRKRRKGLPQNAFAGCVAENTLWHVENHPGVSRPAVRHDRERDEYIALDTFEVRFVGIYPVKALGAAPLKHPAKFPDGLLLRKLGWHQAQTQRRGAVRSRDPPGDPLGAGCEPGTDL